MADTRIIDADLVKFFEDSIKGLKQVDQIYESFQSNLDNPNIWMGGISFRVEREKISKTISDIQKIIKIKVSHQDNIDKIKEHTAKIVADATKVTLALQKNKLTSQNYRTIVLFCQSPIRKYSGYLSISDINY